MRKLLFLVVVAALAGVVVWQWSFFQGLYDDFTKTDTPKIAANNTNKPEPATDAANQSVGTFAAPTPSESELAKAPVVAQPTEAPKVEVAPTPDPSQAAQAQANVALYAPQLTGINSPFATGIDFDPVRIKNCIISPVDEAKVAAQEQGLIVKLTIKEGDMVTAKQVVGNLEDSQPQLAKKVAEAEAAAARHKANSKASINYFKREAEVSKAVWQKARAANDLAAKSVSEVEILLKQLEYEKAMAQIVREEETKVQDDLAARAKDVEVEGAQKAIERREIVSPYDGYIEEIVPHLGEWVKAGDPIFRVKKIDTLRIDGLFNVKRNTAVNLYQLPNRAVEVEFEDVKNGQLRRVPGKVVNVNLSSDGNDEYRMRVEVTNLKDPETNQWVVRPGMVANIVLTPGAK